MTRVYYHSCLGNLWLLNADISSCCEMGVSLHCLPPTALMSCTGIFICIIRSLSYYQPVTAYWTRILFRNDNITQKFLVCILMSHKFTPSRFELHFMLNEFCALFTFGMLCWVTGWLVPDVLRQCSGLKTSVKIWRWGCNTGWKHQAAITQWCIATSQKNGDLNCIPAKA
jgi:hypothetical protein